MALKLSKNTIAAVVETNVKKLQGKGWKLDDQNAGLYKTFSFPCMERGGTFTAAITAKSDVMDHHPKIVLVSLSLWRLPLCTEMYSIQEGQGSVYVYWTTHRPRGLSEKDVSMAEFTENIAADMGSKAVPET